MLRLYSISIFRKKLKDVNNYFPIIFWGPEKFLIKDTIDKIVALFGYRKSIYFVSEVEWNSILKKFFNYSLFEIGNIDKDQNLQSKNIYIIFEFEKLLKDLENFSNSLDYIKNKPIIFIADEDIISTKLLVYYFKGKDISSYIPKDLLEILKNFTLVYSPKLKKDKLKELILQKFSKLNIKLTENALKKLLEITEDLTSLKNETDKLILYALEKKTKLIDEKDVELLCIGIDFDFWETINLFFEENYGKFLEYLKKAYRDNPYMTLPIFLGRLKNIIKGKTSYDKVIFQKYKDKVLKLYKFFIDLDIELRRTYDFDLISTSLLNDILFEEKTSHSKL